MLFLSAQPDDDYFIWQLEIQIFNLKELGISSSEIHVLVGYDPLKGLKKSFNKFVNENTDASFFLYPDTRTNKVYVPSIRPHVIKQHLLRFPKLNVEPFFYLDSDIIFSKIPDFSEMLMGDCWYGAGTANYLDTHYLVQYTNEDVLHAMCEAVGIDVNVVISNDKNCIGAQYIIKGTSYAFWNKVEDDSNKIFNILDGYFNALSQKLFLSGKGLPSQHRGIQIWCSDMWAVFWNALLLNFPVKPSPEMDFCQPFDTLDNWKRLNILHYTAGPSGFSEEVIFQKSKYLDISPINKNFYSIDKKSCSYPLVKLIERLREAKSIKTDLKDVSFLIPVRIDSKERLENLIYVTTYLSQSFATTIFVLEVDSRQNLSQDLFSEQVKYFYLENTSQIFHRTKYMNLLIKKSTSKYIAIYDVDVVTPKKQIVSAIKKLRTERLDYVLPYTGSFIHVDYIFKKLFGTLIDDQLLINNKNKFTRDDGISFGGAIILNRTTYINAGGENENITSWGPDDIERIERMKKLNYKGDREIGELYHLPHSRGVNSYYVDDATQLKLMGEYRRIYAMSKEEVQLYIKEWSWLN